MADNNTDTSSLIIFSGDAEKIKAEIVAQGMAVYREANPGNENGAKAAEMAFSKLADAVAPVVISTAEELKAQETPNVEILSENIKKELGKQSAAILKSLDEDFRRQNPNIANAGDLVTGVGISLLTLAPKLTDILKTKATQELDTLSTAAQEELEGNAADDVLVDNLTNPFASALVALEGRYGQLVERNEKTAAQEKTVVDARSSYLATLRRYQADPNKSPIVSENEKTINGYTKQIEDAANRANSDRQDSIALISRVSPQIKEARAKIEDYLARKNAGEEIPEDEIKEIQALLRSIPGNLDSLENKLSSLSQLANDAPNPARNLDKIVNPAPPVTEVSPAEDNFFYTAARDQFSTGASAGLIGFYTGMESDAGAKLRGPLLQGLSNPEIGKAALKDWPEGKLRYAAPGNPQGAIAAALEVAIEREKSQQSEMRRTIDANVPFGKNVTEQFSATLGAFIDRRGLDGVSGVIYQAGLDGFREAGLDPAKKGQYTQEQLEAATKIIAAKVRTALSTDSNGNPITDSNDIAVIDQLTGVTTSASGIDFSNHYGMNLAGVYESLLTAEYGTETAKANFKSNAAQYFENEKAMAAKAAGAAKGAGNISLVSVYATFMNDPAVVDDILQLATSGDPESVTKLAAKIGQGGLLARKMSAMLQEAGYSVDFGQAQTAIDQAIAPAIALTLQKYGGHLNSGNTLSYNQIVTIASEAGMLADSQMAVMGGIGDLSQPELRHLVAGVYDGTDGSTLSVASMTAALFAARAGDGTAKELVYRQAMRGAADQGLPSNQEIAAGLAGFFPEQMPNGSDPRIANQFVTAAMIDARENAQADGIMRAFQRLWDAIQALICIMSSDQYSLSDFGTLMAQRDQQRFEQKYQANLNGLSPDQLGGYTPQQVFSLSMNRVYEQREGIDRASSLALKFNDGNYGTPGGGASPINIPANLPGFDGQMVALYLDDGTNRLAVTNAETQVGLPEGVKEVARQAAAKGLVTIWDDKDGDKQIGTGEILTANQAEIGRRAAERGGIDF